MKVLFSRGRNDFEHVYELPTVPRVGEHVGLLKSPIMSFPQVYTVTHVYWSPDHTAYDVSVGLEKADNEHVTDDNQLPPAHWEWPATLTESEAELLDSAGFTEDPYPGEVIKEELWRNIERNALSDYPANVADKIMAALTAAGFAVTKAT